MTTLEITVKRLDPDDLMDQLGFDEDAKLWAGALFETLEESDAINKYASYYNAYQPDYSGDGSYSGNVQYGTNMTMRSTFPTLLTPKAKTTMISPPMPFRHGKTTGAMYGVPTEMFLQSPCLSTKRSNTLMVLATMLISLRRTGWAGARQTVWAL